MKPHFVSWGIIGEDQYVEGMLMLFFVLFAGILFSGYVYDRILQLWREQQIVTVERNPFAQERQTPKEIINWEMNQIQVLRRLGLPYSLTVKHTDSVPLGTASVSRMIPWLCLTWLHTKP